jgi:hypothetical protein
MTPLNHREPRERFGPAWPASPVDPAGRDDPHGHLTDDELLLIGAGERREPHVDNCLRCRERLQVLAAIERAIVSTEQRTWADATMSPQRQQLRARLQTRSRRSASGWPGVAAAAAALLLVAFVGWRAPAGRGPVRGAEAIGGATGLHRDALPIRTVTPGATVSLAADELCRQRPLAPSPIPAQVRADVLRAYGKEQLAEHEYELDYLITPDLGGAPDPRNLWPEPYQSPVWNARVKDELEELLPQLVCTGKIDLETAQQDIAADWVAAYKKYFKTDRPLRRS